MIRQGVFISRSASSAPYVIKDETGEIHCLNSLQGFGIRNSEIGDPVTLEYFAQASGIWFAFPVKVSHE